MQVIVDIVIGGVHASSPGRFIAYRMKNAFQKAWLQPQYKLHAYIIARVHYLRVCNRMQPSIPPIGRRLSFSTSQVDLTHNDDYVVTIVNIINITTIVFTSMQ